MALKYTNVVTNQMRGKEGSSTGNGKKVPGTGASTPVSVKVKRMEQKIKDSKEGEKKKNRI